MDQICWCMVNLFKCDLTWSGGSKLNTARWIVQKNSFKKDSMRWKIWPYEKTIEWKQNREGEIKRVKGLGEVEERREREKRRERERKGERGAEGRERERRERESEREIEICRYREIDR